MMIEIRESQSYYAWTVYTDGEYAGMVIKEPAGGFSCPRGGIDSDKTFSTIKAAAEAIADAQVVAA